MAEQLDAETIAFTHRMFDLARVGASGELGAQTAAGPPVNLTNAEGDTPLVAHRGA